MGEMKRVVKDCIMQKGLQFKTRELFHFWNFPFNISLGL